MDYVLMHTKRCFLIGVVMCLVGSVYAELVPFQEKKLWGLQDENGTVVIKPKYSGIGDCSALYAWVTVGGKGGYPHCPANAKWGVIDKNGVEICPAVYDYVDFCNDHYVMVNNGGVMNADNRTITGGTWGIFDLHEKREVVPCIYTLLGPINEKGLCWAQKNGKIARRLIAELVKDKKSKITDVKPSFYVEPDFMLKDMMLRYRDDGKWGLIDMTGKAICEFEYTKVERFIGECAVVYQNRKAGIISDTGVLLVPCMYYDLKNPIGNPVFWAMRDHHYALYNMRNEALTPEKYMEISPFFNGVAWAKDSTLYALVDMTGKEVVPPTYTKVFPFYNGLATVSTGMVGVINPQGETIVPLVYQDAPPFFGDNQFRPIDPNSPDCIGYVKNTDGTCVWFNHDGKELVKNGKEVYGALDTIPDALWNY